MIIRGKYIYCFLVFFVFLFPCTSNAINADDIVAIVEGVPIKYSDIKVENKDNAAKMKSEKLKLKKLINKFVREKSIKNLGIKITQEDLEEKIKEIYPGVNKKLSEIHLKENEFFLAIYESLYEVHIKGKDAKDVYDQNLKSKLKKEQWSYYVNTFNTAEKIESFRKAIPENVDDTYKSYEKAVEPYVIEDKIETELGKQIKVSEEDIYRYYTSKYKGDKKIKFEDVKLKLKKDLIDERKNEYVKEWWIEQFSKAKIRILVPEFQNAIN